MKKVVLIVIAVLMFCGSVAYAEEAPIETPEVVVIELVPTPTPTPVLLTPPPATPKPTPLPDLPDYDLKDSDVRALSRGLWSVCPAAPTYATKVAFCELVQNRVDDESGDFKDTIPDVLLQPHEFLDYDAKAFRSRENNSIAEYTLKAWIYAELTGNRMYRVLPKDGLYCDFYRINGWDYIKIYNRAGDLVYDSGTVR